MSGRGPRLTRVAAQEYRRLARSEGMPPATHPEVQRDRDIPVRAHDGAALLTDHWHAPDAADSTLLIRTPYGRDGIAGVAKFIAERGHHVIVQSCRGTFGSEGEFSPLHDEVADGQSTLTWLRAQPWATGRVHTWGGSYFGVTQWALCDGPDRPDAMGIAVSARRFDDGIIYPGGGFAIDTTVAWSFALRMQERPLLARIGMILRAASALRRGSLTVPPAEAAQAAVGTDPRFFRDWVEHSQRDDPWWEPLHFAQDLASIPPVALVAGWRDLFLQEQLKDHAALVAGGVPAKLAIGDWLHGAPETSVMGVRDALVSFDSLDRLPDVRIEVTGGIGWRELDSWPPPAESRVWAATAAGGLRPGAPDERATPLSYRYDPADPTPSEGGRTLGPFASGYRIQRRREARSDVVLFTSDPLDDDLLIIGEPRVEITLTSTNPRVDLFVRLCDVDERGRSRTVTDGYIRRNPEAGTHTVLQLASLAHRFAAGHRLRLQVSSGAHPVYLRNPGTADPIRDHSRLLPSEQTFDVGGEHALALHLPAVDGAVLRPMS
ncbi:CocE/NonD family hydrolase [Microbacterium nymphoidis]|uniref:CocE/NonD family hydrolase n=1 Tax=Microbacterium nymphoidis TaxID=2898586 RepID=UPI001E54AA54|nr:CocE/NonD family hydrolase [Microbacterium nymphoidis]MCD2497063.1 CocE/NonD family hydrolase [Microbacterium nymphoidis]